MTLREFLAYEDRNNMTDPCPGCDAHTEPCDDHYETIHALNCPYFTWLTLGGGLFECIGIQN